jgi:transcription initiation factor TFIID TATA-box-binding protein
MNQPIIRNIVCTTQIPTAGLDLKQLSMKLWNSEYRPARFTALVLRIKEPVRATALIFPNGKMVCVGTTSLVDAEKAVTQFVNKIVGGNPIAPMAVKNIVCSFTLGEKLGMNGELFFTKNFD